MLSSKLHNQSLNILCYKMFNLLNAKIIGFFLLWLQRRNVRYTQCSFCRKVYPPVCLLAPQSAQVYYMYVCMLTRITSLYRSPLDLFTRITSLYRCPFDLFASYCVKVVFFVYGFILKSGLWFSHLIFVFICQFVAFYCLIWYTGYMKLVW